MIAIGGGSEVSLFLICYVLPEPILCEGCFNILWFIINLSSVSFFMFLSSQYIHLSDLFNVVFIYPSTSSLNHATSLEATLDWRMVRHVVIFPCPTFLT